MKVKITEIPTTTYKYNYEFKDSLGIKTRVENIESIEATNKHIKAKMKKLKSDYETEIVKL